MIRGLPTSKDIRSGHLIMKIARPSLRTLIPPEATSRGSFAEIQRPYFPNMLFGDLRALGLAASPRMEALPRPFRNRAVSRLCSLILWVIREQLFFARLNPAFWRTWSVPRELRRASRLIAPRILVPFLLSFWNQL